MKLEAFNGGVTLTELLVSRLGVARPWDAATPSEGLAGPGISGSQDEKTAEERMLETPNWAEAEGARIAEETPPVKTDDEVAGQGWGDDPY